MVLENHHIRRLPEPFFYCNIKFLVCSAPVNHLLSRFSTAYALVRQVLLCERHAAGGCSGVFFDLVLAGLIAAPHSFYKTRFLIDGLYKLIVSGCNVGVGIAVCSCALQHIILDGV